MIPIGTSFELRQQAFSTIIVLEPEGVPVHVIFPAGPCSVLSFYAHKRDDKHAAVWQAAEADGLSSRGVTGAVARRRGRCWRTGPREEWGGFRAVWAFLAPDALSRAPAVPLWCPLPCPVVPRLPAGTGRTQ
jgi:hypothetical protein